EQIGTMGKDVRDTAMLYDLICGHDPMDATTYNCTYPDFISSLKTDVNGLRIGVPEEYFGDFVDDEVKNAIFSSIKLLESNGAVVRNISLPHTRYAVNAYYIISSAEASSNLARYDGVRYGHRAEDPVSLRDMYERTRSEGFGWEVNRRIMLGTFVLSSGYYDEYYIKAQNARRMISHELSEAFRDNDVIITPTYPVPAFKSGKSSTDILSVYAQDICTVPANISGIPAINVPCGTISHGLPVGMQIMGKHFSEKLLFDTAYAFERITDGIYTGGAVR
ncbi:MAG: Asp-tRNA(Asn)/Glu-tRNA(Gln) amidotransferase subunit GatA, partial [Oscillospiraceae bacterium]|nr:Asp-tRNA(Asn)/Glu-tRNA(Gln) amidotransferase subunit GatA [Oscillospiraceae bacterium]